MTQSGHPVEPNLAVYVRGAKLCRLKRSHRWRRQHDGEALLPDMKAKCRCQRYPVGVFTVDVASVDQIDVEFIDRTPTQPDLETRFGHANGVLPGAKLTEHFSGQGPDIIRRTPIHARSISRIMLARDIVPFPASVEIDPYYVRQAQRRGDGNKCGGILLPRKIVDCDA